MISIDNADESEKAITATIYPNTTTGAFTVNIEDSGVEIQESRIEVMNVLGEVIYQSAIVNQQSIIDISSQSKGINFVRIMDKDNNTVFTERVVKE